MYVKYVKKQSRDDYKRYCFFYFGKVSTTTKETEFYKKYESGLLMEHPTNDSFVTVLEHQGTLSLSEILSYIRLDKDIQFAVGMRVGHEWFGTDSLQGCLDEVHRIHDTEQLEYTWKLDAEVKPWSFVKGNNDNLYIFNPLQNQIFIDNDVNTWLEKSKAEDLRVVHGDSILDTPTLAKENQWPGWDQGRYENKTADNFQDIDYTLQNEHKEKLKKSSPNLIYSHSNLGSDQKKELFQKKRKTLIYHSVYENEIKNEFENFEEVVSFDHWDDLFTIFEKEKSDAVILLGGLASFTFFTKSDLLNTVDKAQSFIYKMISGTKTSVWAKCPHTNQEIFIND